jgi:hypothetical protein
MRGRMQRMNGHRLVYAAVFAGVLVGVVIFLRSWQTNEADRSICKDVDRLEQVLERIVIAGAVPPKPGEYGYAYWKAHPEEAANRPRLTVAQIQTLREGACDPDSLPPIPGDTR